MLTTVILTFALCSTRVPISQLTPENARARGCFVFTVDSSYVIGRAGTVQHPVEMHLNSLSCAVKGEQIALGYLNTVEGKRGAALLIKDYPYFSWQCATKVPGQPA